MAKQRKSEIKTNKLDKAKNWAFNHKLIVGLVILVSVLSFIWLGIQTIESLYKWLKEKKDIVFIEKFENQKEQLNILLTNFVRLEKDLAAEFKIEESIQNRLYDLNEKYHANLQIIYDKKNCPNNFIDAEKLAKDKGADIIIFGNYFEKSSEVEIKYIYLTKELSTHIDNDTALFLNIEINTKDSVQLLSLRKRTGIVKIEKLSEISDLSNIKLFKNIDYLIYSILANEKLEKTKYKECIAFTDIMQNINGLEDMNVYYYRIICYKNSKDYNNLLNVCNDVIRIKPNEPGNYFNRAKCNLELKKPNDALKDLNKCLVLNCNYENALLERGKIFYNYKKYQNAYIDFNKILKNNPKNVEAYINRGVLNLETKNYVNAIQDFNLAISLNEKNSISFMNRGTCKKRMKNYYGALEDYNKAIYLDTNNILAYFNRGSLYLNEINDIQNAISDLSIAIKKDTNYRNAYLLRYYCYIKLQNNEKQIEDMNELIRLDSNNYEFYNIRGYNYLVLSKYESAIDDFTKSITLNTKYAVAYINRGWAYSKLENYNKAIQDFNISFHLFRNNSYLFTFRGLTYYKMKRFKEALKDLNIAVATNKEYYVEIRDAIQEIEKNRK